MSRGPQKRSLLELMSPPPGQSLKAAVLTTFDLDLDYLERFVLPTMVGLNTVGADEESDAASRTNLELRSRLRRAQVAILADKKRFDFSARKAMETYELLFAETFPAFHPKLFLLAFEHDFRLVVSSANLTESGFHTNLEVLWHASTENGDRFGNLAEEAMQFLSSLAAREWPRSQALAQILSELTYHLPKGRCPACILHSSSALSLMDQWKQAMKHPRSFDELHIVAPFFDKSGRLSPLTQLPSSSLRLYVVETSVKGQPQFNLRITKKTLSTLKPPISVISPAWMLNNGDSRAAPKHAGRILHAKIYVARTGAKGWALLGSPNFSHRAMTATGHQRNAEVAVATSGPWKSIRRLLPAVDREISWKEVSPWTAEKDDEGAAWLPFLQSAEFDASSERLTLVFSRRQSRAHWAVKYRRKVLLQGGPSAFPTSKILAFTLADATSLHLEEGSQTGWFPIGVKDKEMLPELPGAGLPGYEDILDLLAHGIGNLGQLIKRTRARKNPKPPTTNDDEHVAYLEKLSRLIKALENMKRRLSSYLTTPGEAQSIFNGDLGFNRVVEGIHSDQTLDNIFRLFALLELQSVLASTSWKGRPHAVRSAQKLSKPTKRRLARHIRAVQNSLTLIPVELPKLRKLYATQGASAWQRKYESHQG